MPIPPCSLLEQCWEAGERGTLAARVSDLYRRSSQLSSARVSSQHRPSTAHTATVRRGGVEAGSVTLFPTPAWAHADHPRLPHGQCWPGRVQSGPVTSHVHGHGLVWGSSQSSPARGLTLNSPHAPSPSRPSEPSTRARAGIGLRQPHVHGRDRETPLSGKGSQAAQTGPLGDGGESSMPPNGYLKASETQQGDARLQSGSRSPG